MNNPSPLVPQGIVDQKNIRRARVKIAVFFVLALHGVGLLALLLQGCHREDANTLAAQTPTNALPAFEAATLQPIGDTNAPILATNQSAQTDLTNAPAATATEYTVASRDTFSTIAKKFGVTSKAIADANPSIEPTKLQIGQKLHIPALTKMPAAGSGTMAQSVPGTDHSYQVKSGDTLIKIAAEHRTSVRAIRSANNLKSNRITVGQKLKIPARVSTPAETASASPTLPAGVPTAQ